MESDFDSSDGAGRTDGAAAREALSALHADRQALADRIRTPAWYYPLLALSTALIIGSPGPGVPGQFVMVVFGCLGITFLSLAYQRITGMTITWVAGPKSLAVSIVLGVVIVLLLGVSFALTATGHPEWVVASAAAAFVTMWGGGRLCDRVYARELRDGR
jgi:hypothetical protein